jgi:hypothetical protein
MLRSALAAAAQPVPASADAPTGAAASAPSVVVLMLMRYQRRSLAWGLSRLVMGPRDLQHTPGLRFARVLGSGRDGSFGLAPSFLCQGLIAFFDDTASAHRFVASAPAVQARRERSEECLTAVLGVSSSRGSWGGVSLAASSPIAGTLADDQPMASLTRAAIRPRHAARFWRHSPASEASLAQTPGCRLAVGLGEAPLLRQATFSLWDNTAAMKAYAQQGAHQAASRAAWANGWFSEWMFVRFAPLALQGRWRGQTYG